MISIRIARRMVITILAAVLLISGATAVVVSRAAGSTNPDRSASAAPGTAFTYQGILDDGGAPAEGVYDFRFRLYNALNEGGQVAPPVFLRTSVNQGLFTAVLDFGDVFNGAPRFLEVAVRPGNSNDAYTTLTPRQPLTPVPYSIHASTTPWDGLTGVPADIADGDQDTVYEAGFGLKLSQNQIPVRYLVDQETIQRRVTGNCEVGQAIATISEDGSVTCQKLPIVPVAPRPLNGNVMVEEEGIVGSHSSITIGSDGLPLISYYDGGVNKKNLKVAHCNNMACTDPAINVVDDGGFGGDVGQFSSITIGTDGLGLISYYDVTNGDLKVAHCNSIICDSSNTYNLSPNTSADMGSHSSITIATDGNGLISFRGNDKLMVAHCDNLACSSATKFTHHNAPNTGYYNSIALGVDGLAIIGFFWDGLDPNKDLMVAHCANVECSTLSNPGVTSLDTSGDVGRYASITIGSDGLPLIGYYDATNDNLKIIHCRRVDCQTIDSPTAVSGSTDTGSHASITIGADGKGLISYYDATGNQLGLVHCNNLECNDYNRFTPDNSVDSGKFSSITTGPDGLAYISYHQQDGLDFGNLKLARTTLGSGVRHR